MEDSIMGRVRRTFCPINSSLWMRAIAAKAPEELASFQMAYSAVVNAERYSAHWRNGTIECVLAERSVKNFHSMSTTDTEGYKLWSRLNFAWQTLKAKMEQAELQLSQRSRSSSGPDSETRVH